MKMQEAVNKYTGIRHNLCYSRTGLKPIKHETEDAGSC